MDPVNANILVCEDERNASLEAAERFVCAAVRAVAKRGVFYVAIPGGSSPRGMFGLLCGREFEDMVPWTRTELFFTDERCVPPESDESNFKLASELLMSTVPIPEVNIHRMRGEDPPEIAAEAYENELVRVMGPRPRFDLIVLGMGTNTHTASLFPNSPALQETGKHVVANYISSLNTYRLTLTFPAINQAEQVIILAFGADKSAPLAEVFRGTADTDLHPVQAIQPTSGHLLWIVDRAAASKL